jgi:hypothetical protein
MSDQVQSIRPALFRKHIALPQQHGSWALWLGPFAAGVAIGGRLTGGLLWLTLAMLGMFLALQPLTILVKTLAGRRPAEERGPALAWLGLYGAAALAGVLGLVAAGRAWVLGLGVLMAPVLAWQMWLVARREERGQMLVESLGAAALALSAPAAEALGFGAFTGRSLVVWGLCALQAIGAIVYVYGSLDYRRMKAVPAWPERWSLARASLLWNAAALAGALGLALAGWAPPLAPAGFGLMLAEAVYGGLLRPPVGARPVVIGVRQMVVTGLFSLALIAAYRWG